MANNKYERLLSSYQLLSVRQNHAVYSCVSDYGYRLTGAVANQELSFGGVDSYHQNVIVENVVEMVTEKGYELLLHAQRCWSKAISQAHWPFALKFA